MLPPRADKPALCGKVCTGITRQTPIKTTLLSNLQVMKLSPSHILPASTIQANSPAQFRCDNTYCVALRKYSRNQGTQPAHFLVGKSVRASHWTVRPYLLQQVAG